MTGDARLGFSWEKWEIEVERSQPKEFPLHRKPLPPLPQLLNYELYMTEIANPDLGYFFVCAAALSLKGQCVIWGFFSDMWS